MLFRSNFIANTTQVTISGIPLSANGTTGTSGQVLTSNGSTGAPYWTTASGGGATASDDDTTDGDRYILFANQTSGSITTAYVSSTKLTYNPSTGGLTATLFTSSSDRRLKENIEIISDPLVKIKQINGITFNYKDNKHQGAGVIAQDVEKVLPQLVSSDQDGFKSVLYDGLIGLLIEAIKDQQKQIDILSNEIENLKK